MPFLDETGLAHFWNQIIARLNGKMASKNPEGTGRFSMNRLPDSTIGTFSSTFGNRNTASDHASFAEGEGTTASRMFAHAEGYFTTASGVASHAEGGGSNRAADFVPDDYTKDNIITVWNTKKFSIAKGQYSHVEGIDCLALDNGSHAEGQETQATGESSHAEGGRTTACGNFSHAEGSETTASSHFSHSEGEGSTASGMASHAEGAYTEATGIVAHAEGYGTIAGQYQHASGKYNASKTAPTSVGTQDSSNADAIFMVGCGTAAARKNALRISSGGKCFGTSAFGATGADFAELFEWVDGNPNNEDRRGLFVTLDGEKIRIANAGDDYIGVVSGAQAFIGNSASEEWQGKYLTDVFGTKLSKEVEIPAVINEETGDVITPATTTTQYVLNPEYNPDEEYVMRENRKEWGIVGLLGQIVMIDDGTCVVGGRVAPSANGIGTAANDGYRVMKRIDENHIKVLVK